MTAKLTTLFSAVVVLMFGCESPTKPPMTIKGTGERLSAGPVVLDDSLQRKTWFGLGREVTIVLEDHGRSRTPTGTHRVWVRLRNVTDFDQHVQARAHFLGVNGQEVEPPSPWGRIFIPAKSIETYEAMSVGEDIDRFYVELREGR